MKIVMIEDFAIANVMLWVLNVMNVPLNFITFLSVLVSLE